MEPCHFDTVLVPVQVPTSYFPSYGSGSGSGSGGRSGSGSGLLHSFNKNLKKISFNHISIETGWKQVDFNLELFNLIFYSDSFQN